MEKQIECDQNLEADALESLEQVLAEIRAQDPYGVRRAAALVFGGSEPAKKWLAEPLWALGGKRPIDFMADREQAQTVLDLLGRMEHGIFS
jgi:putative toxin-antitoxin system antitoxin component (TIGR02293 family)